MSPRSLPTLKVHNFKGHKQQPLPKPASLDYWLFVTSFSIFYPLISRLHPAFFGFLFTVSVQDLHTCWSFCLEHSSPPCPLASLLPLLRVFFLMSSSQRGFPWLRFATPCLGLLPSPSLALFPPLQRLFILVHLGFGLASPRLASKCLRD